MQTAADRPYTTHTAISKFSSLNDFVFKLFFQTVSNTFSVFRWFKSIYGRREERSVVAAIRQGHPNRMVNQMVNQMVTKCDSPAVLNLLPLSQSSSSTEYHSFRGEHSFSRSERIALALPCEPDDETGSSLFGLTFTIARRFKNAFKFVFAWRDFILSAIWFFSCSNTIELLERSPWRSSPHFRSLKTFFLFWKDFQQSFWKTFDYTVIEINFRVVELLTNFWRNDLVMIFQLIQVVRSDSDQNLKFKSLCKFEKFVNSSLITLNG